jgi:phage shock protein C
MRKLYRSAKNRVIGGVCAGLGEYLVLDESLIRILALLSLFLGSAGFWIYLFAWAVIPKEEVEE